MQDRPDNRRVILIVMDSLGCGAMPDASEYGDAGTNTISHIAEACGGLRVPNLESLGFHLIEGVDIGGSLTMPGEHAAWGRMMEASKGKDTITGHWEIAGLVTETPFQTFTDTGFPQSFIEEFEEKIGLKVIGNYSASGTEIIEELGPEHAETGFPIVYTSADSVFQIAANTAVIPLERLYEICAQARELLYGDLLVGRVIARPFVVEDGLYTRTSDRRDYAVEPPADTMLEHISRAGHEVCAVGKIEDIFAGKGITASIHTKDNADGIATTLDFMKSCRSGLVFTNLVDFDALYGHRRDAEGYGRAIEEFDRGLGQVIEAMRPEDLLILTADHGNDPLHRGWNHTREYVPIMMYGNIITDNHDLGTRDTFADVAATVCHYLGTGHRGAGKSLLD